MYKFNVGKSTVTALIRVPYHTEKSLVVLTPWFLRMFLMELEELVHDQPCHSQKEQLLTSASQTGQNGYMKMLYQMLQVLNKAKTIKLNVTLAVREARLKTKEIK